MRKAIKIFIMSFALMLGIFSAGMSTVQARDIVFFYNDVSGSSTYYEIIKLYHAMGVLEQTDMFRPEQTVTEDEFDVMYKAFLNPAGLTWTNNLTRAEAVVMLHEGLMKYRLSNKTENILIIENGVITDYSTGKDITTTIEVIDADGVRIEPDKIGFKWIVGTERASVYSTTVSSDGSSSSKVYNITSVTNKNLESGNWIGSFTQLYKGTGDRVYVPVKDSTDEGLYLSFKLTGTVSKKENFVVDKPVVSRNSDGGVSIDISGLERQRIYVLPGKFKVGKDGYADIGFKVNPTDLSSLYLHYGDRRVKVDQLPIHTNLLGEYILELNGRLYYTLVYNDPPLAEFKTYRAVKYINSVREADISAKNVLIVKDTAGLDIIDLIVKDIYVVTESDSANILGLVDGEIGIRYTGEEKQYTQIFSVGETVNYDIKNDYERWIYRTAGKTDQVTLSPISTFGVPARYRVDYETYDGSRLSTNYKASVSEGLKSLEVGASIPNLPNPTIPKSEYVTQKVPDWYKPLTVASVDRAFAINSRLTQLSLEADEVLIVDKSGNVDNTVGTVNDNMLLTLTKVGEYETYLLYRQGSIVRRAKLVVQNNMPLMLAFNTVFKYEWATEIAVSAVEILKDGYNIPADSVIEIVGEPMYGTVEYKDGTVIYKPEEGFGGLDAFYYKTGSSNVAQVIIDVVPKPQPPIAVDDIYTMPISLISMQFDILANDISLDGTDLKIVSVKSSKGVVSTAYSNYTQLLNVEINPKNFRVGDKFTIECTIGGSTGTSVSTTTIVIGEPENGYITIKERVTGIITYNNGVFGCETTGNVVEWHWRVGREKAVFEDKAAGLAWLNSIDVQDNLVQLRVVDEDGIMSVTDIYETVIFTLSQSIYTEGDIFRINNKDIGAVYNVSAKSGQPVVSSADESEIFEEVCSFIRAGGIHDFIIEYSGYTVEFQVYLQSDNPNVRLKP